MESMQNFRPNVIIKKGKDNVATTHQKTFNRLINKVQDLQNQQEKRARELDEALQFYHATIRPDEVVYVQQLIERVTIAYEFYKTTKGFSKNELKTFKAWLRKMVDQICSIHEPQNIPATIKEMFKELNGTGYDECFAQELDAFKEGLQEKIKDFFGEDIDLSDVDFSGSQEDIMREVFMKMGKAATDFEEKASQAPKTKKQLEKEAKKQAVEELQSKSLQNIYKQLARILHPDLERDVERRTLKEELMKQLTVAYDKNDLYSLLKIEMAWMNHSVDKMQSHNDDDIKIYNAILKDQIQELEVANDMLFMHPRYTPIQRFYQYGFSGIVGLQQKYNGLKQLIREVQDTISQLKTPQAKTIVKEIIREQIAMTKKRACTCGSC